MFLLHEYLCKSLVVYCYIHYLFFVTTLVFLGKEQLMLLKKKLRQSAKSGELILSGRNDDNNITVDWKLAFSIPPRSLTSSLHITTCWGCGWTERLGWALLGPLTLVLPSQLVHQVGFACAVEPHDSHHHNRLPDGRQDLQGFWINQQSSINVLNEALWASHVDLWGHVPLSAREDMG